MNHTVTNQISILDVSVSTILFSTLISVIKERCVSKAKNKPFFIVTAYSEFFLEAKKNEKFKQALQQADVRVPDGVSVIEAMDFVQMPKSNLVIEFFRGLLIGVKTLSGGYPDRITGIRIIQSLIMDHSLKIFLLGGWNGVAKKLAAKYNVDYYEGPNNITNSTQEEQDQIIKAINAVSPDIILVSFGRFKQEVWIAENLDKIHCKVIIGVGSAFDELLGEGKWAKKVPSWVERMGLKWLWRVTQDISHIKRAWNAFPVFPIKVFLSKVTS